MEMLVAEMDEIDRSSPISAKAFAREVEVRENNKLKKRVYG